VSDEQETLPAEPSGNPSSGTGDDPGSSGRPEEPQDSPLFPPPQWLFRVNEGRAGRGLPALTSMDPRAMLLWHTCSRPPEGNMLRVTGI
jgi:hypothetical protein